MNVTRQHPGEFLSWVRGELGINWDSVDVHQARTEALGCVSMSRIVTEYMCLSLEDYIEHCAIENEQLKSEQSRKSTPLKTTLTHISGYFRVSDDLPSLAHPTMTTEGSNSNLNFNTITFPHSCSKSH